MILKRIAAKSGLFRCLQDAVAQRYFPGISAFHSTNNDMSSNRTSIVRCSKQKFERMYPVLLVRPDGSTITIRYKEPKRIIMMPVDISTLPEAERKARLRRRDPKKDLVKDTMDEIDDGFDVDNYSKFWRKK